MPAAGLHAIYRFGPIEQTTMTLSGWLYARNSAESYRQLCDNALSPLPSLVPKS